jgi:hypothetical protein
MGATVLALEPGHSPPATLPPPSPRRETRNKLKPPAAFRIPASTVQLRHLRAAAIGHLHPDMTVPGPDRDRLAAAPDRLCRTLLPDSSLPAGRRHPRTGARDQAPRRRTRGRPAPAPPARPPSRSPGSAAQPSAPAFPGRPPPRQITGAGRPCVRACTLDSAAHVKPELATGAARPWPSVKQPTVRTDRPGGPTPSAICPWTPRHSGPQRNKATHHGTEKKRPA